jgi:GUN4-like/NACHT domain
MPPEPESKDAKDTAGEKLPLNEQIASIVLKVVMTGGVAGGGLGAFWALFKESDVPKAIASAAIGLGLSYAAKMLQPVHEGNQRRLENAGKALDKTIDDAIGFVGGKVSGGTPEDRYLQCQAWDCQALRSEGVAQQEGIFTPLLAEVFVPLALASSANIPGFKAISSKAIALEIRDNDELSIWKVLAKTDREPTFRQLAILAWGGYGKTTLLKHIAYIYGTKQHQKYKVPKRIPVLLALRKYRDLLAQDNPPDLPELIVRHHVPSLPGASDLEIGTEWTKQMLKRGEAVVMLDGFDEVAKTQRPAVARWIDMQMRQYGKSVFILTTRPKAYTEQEPTDRLVLNTPLWVQEFNSRQRKNFVERWHLCQERYANGGRDTPDVRQAARQTATELLEQIEARPELKDLAKNPLLLNMIVTFHRRYPGADLPKRRVELYREICLLQLRDRPSARKLETLLTQCEAQIILQMLALEMMQNRLERMERSDLLEWLAAYLIEQDERIEAEEFLSQVVQISELLVEREQGEYEFAHLSFQEYLAAVEIVRLKQESLLYEYFSDDWWKPTILLYAAQIKPTNLIDKMVKLGATDLAYVCLQETTKRIDPALESELKTLKQTVQASRYRALEEHLANGRWEEADNETYRLMITAVGREEGQWFEPEELLNFPSEELLTIDRLWVKYSNGKFGFSVQKKIYQDCGGILDGKYNKKAWESFCSDNGWMKDGKRVKNGYDISSPRGHLPCVRRNWRWRLKFYFLIKYDEVACFLLSHRDL